MDNESADWVIILSDEEMQELAQYLFDSQIAPDLPDLPEVAVAIVNKVSIIKS